MATLPGTFFVMVYASAYEQSTISARTICPSPPCGSVSFTSIGIGYQVAEVIDSSNYNGAKSKADVIAKAKKISGFTLIRIDLNLSK
jgi:hypothetical protein